LIIEIGRTSVLCMSSLVIDLQHLGLAPETRLADLLLRAKVVAVKLDLDDARVWIDQELNGYALDADVPSYRVVPTELRTKNPAHGWNAVAWGGPGPLVDHFASAKLREPIAQIEAIAIGGEGEPLTNVTQPEMDVLLATEAGTTFARLPTARFFGRASFVGILQAVRTKVLDWALALEKRNVLGEGMTFNDAERRGAAEVPLRADDTRLIALFLSANPDADSPLNVEKEQNRIVKVRNGSRHQRVIRIESLPDLDLPELAKSLRLHAPAVVHFSGHGSRDGSLLMRDENGGTFAMHPEGLSDFLSLAKNSVRLVVLNACFSNALADLLVAHIDCVVGMSDAVSDNAAILFAQALYGALFDGATVADSFATSLAAVKARYRDEAHVPVLGLKAGVDASKVRLLE
jgi:hypothetical protein